MNLKKSLRNTVMTAVALTVAFPAYAVWTGPICWMTVVCVPLDILNFAARLWGIAAEKKLMRTEISATEGLQPILDNIGKGNGPGVSATGNSGADLTSEEEGAQMQAQQAMNAATVPDVLVELVTDAERSADGLDFWKIREANLQQALSDYCSECATSGVDGVCKTYKERDCTQEERDKINRACNACNAHNDQDLCVSYDAGECAKERQNVWIYTAANGAIGTVDAHQDEVKKLYEDLKALLASAGSTGTVAGFWSDLQMMSVQSSVIAPEITYVYSTDLLAMSIRRMYEGGVEYERLPTTTSGSGGGTSGTNNGSGNGSGS